jgi:hypothetical protein
MPWEDQIFPDGTGGAASPFHLAIETKLSEAEVVAEAKSRGWRSASCERGGVFGVVEVWVDNKYLVEVLVAEQAVRYRQFMRPSGCSAMFGEGVSAPFTRNS